MEKVEDYKPDQEAYTNDIEMYLQLFCDQNGIDDMCKESQSRWNAALMDVRKNVFPDREVFRNHKYLTGGNCIMNSTYYTYDLDMVDDVCDIYIYLCMKYDKEISILGFSALTGIPDGSIYDWSYKERKLSSKGAEIYQKLTKYNEESLSNKLASGKGNPVGIIAMLNRKHGWASPYTADSARQRQEVLTAAQLPRLGNTKTCEMSAIDGQKGNDLQQLCNVHEMDSD